MARVQRDKIDKALDGIERLQRSYMAERMIFLGGAIASLLLTIGLAIYLLLAGNVSAVWPLLGSSGVFMGTAVATMRYFDQSFALLRELVTGDDA